MSNILIDTSITLGRILRTKSLLWVCLCSLMAVASTWADAPANTVAASEPHRLIDETTVKVIAVLKSGVDPVNKPEEFIQKLSVVLDPVVAFDFIAKGVMGQYAKQVSPEQRKQFSKSFKQGLVSTYGRGVSSFNDVDIVVLPPTKPLGNQRSTTVVQEVRTSGGVNKVAYSMAKTRDNQWKMTNVVLNGINLGQTFRSQFAATVSKNNGDVAKTINEWGKG